MSNSTYTEVVGLEDEQVHLAQHPLSLSLQTE